MKYLNLTLNDLGSENFLGSTPTQRATWLCLLKYCAQQETGGIIKQANEWGVRKWMFVCGVTKDEVLDSCPLWRWEDGDLVVWAYPKKQELAAQSRRESGKKYGEGHPKEGVKPSKSSPKSSPLESPKRSTRDKDKGKGKGKDKDKDKGKDNIPKKPKKHIDNATNRMSKEYSEMTDTLVGIVESHKKVNCNSKKSQWTKQFRLMHERDGIEIPRIKRTLSEYAKIIGQTYVPQSYSGRSFREDFLRIENAIEREKNPPKQKKPVDPDVAKSQSLSGIM